MMQVDVGGANARGPETAEDGSTPTAALPDSGLKELRLGLVCYGGVSLAIYMHGVTAELQRLVRASAAYCSPGWRGTNPFPTDTTEHVYWDALNEVCATGDRAALRVVVDVITGTSAGGINGVVLAKALAHGLSQDPLRDVWFDKASLLKLLMRSPQRLVREGLLPPLDGRRMSRWAYEALSAMNDRPTEESAPGSGSLVPRENELDLFVTTTDTGGYRRTLDLYDPESVRDTEYRHVLRFRYSPEEHVDMFDKAHDRALTLAIRSTSSFPGAFPPVNLKELQDVIGDFAGDVERDRFYSSFFASYLLEGHDPSRSFLVDGGVLNNKPFDHAVRTIMERTADREVDRRLLFIEPHPVEPLPSPVEPPLGRKARPSWLHTVFSALSAIPSHQPIADALADLARHNQRAIEFRHLIAVTEPGCIELIRRAAAKVPGGVTAEAADRLYELNLETIDRWAGVLQDEAKVTTGAAYAAYEVIKTGEVLRDLAKGICALFEYPIDSHHAGLVRRIVQIWAEQQGLLGPAVVGDAASAEGRVTFLRNYDINFRRRRLRFLVRSLNDLYRDLYHRGPGHDGVPPRGQIDAAKKGLYDLIKKLRDIQEGRWAKQARGIKDALDPFFGRTTIDALGLGEPGGPRLDARIKKLLEERAGDVQNAFDMLGDEIRRQLEIFREEQTEGLSWLLKKSELPWNVLQRMLERYVGFAFWDTILYPLLAVSGIAEPDPVEVIRISPNDTRLLKPIGVEKRLKGIEVFHFNAFLKRAFRENDFLWGRLDGVERLLGLLDDVARRQGGGNGIDARLAWRGFKSVLTAEEGNMKDAKSKKLVQDLLVQVDDALSPGGVGVTAAARATLS